MVSWSFWNHTQVPLLVESWGETSEVMELRGQRKGDPKNGENLKPTSLDLLLPIVYRQKRRGKLLSRVGLKRHQVDSLQNRRNLIAC